MYMTVLVWWGYVYGCVGMVGYVYDCVGMVGVCI